MRKPEINCAYDKLEKTTKVRPNPRNPNKHPAEQRRIYAKILRHQGFRKAIVALIEQPPQTELKPVPVQKPPKMAWVLVGIPLLKPRSRMENSHLTVKIDLRRHFLERYHPAGERRVFDAFQAKGLLWSVLRKDFPLTSYWGVDLVEKKGRMKVDSARVLAQPGWRENIIDLDAYGSPWKHWLGMLATAERSLTVFLTLGSRKGIQRRPLTKVEKQLLDIPFKLPRSIGANLVAKSVDWMLAQACGRFKIVESVEALPSTTARYFGLRLEPAANLQK